MADTTIEKVLIMAPELTATLTPDVFELYLSDAKLELEKYKLPEGKDEKAQRLLIAHYMTTSKISSSAFVTGGGGIITKKKLGPLEISYSSSSNTSTSSSDTTRWLDELNRLLKGITRGTFELFS